MLESERKIQVIKCSVITKYVTKRNELIDENKQNLNSKQFLRQKMYFWSSPWSLWHIKSNSGCCTSTVNKYRMQFDSDAEYLNYESVTPRCVHCAFVHLWCFRLSCCLQLSFIIIVTQNQQRCFYKDPRLEREDRRLVKTKKTSSIEKTIKRSSCRWTLNKRKVKVAAVPTINLKL